MCKEVFSPVGPYSRGADEGMAEVNEVKLSCLAPEASGVAHGLEHNVIMEKRARSRRKKLNSIYMSERRDRDGSQRLTLSIMPP